MTEYSYRAMYRCRRVLPEGPTEWSEWQTIYTARGGGREYRTLGSARGVLSRQKRENQRKSNRVGYYEDYEWEYKVQRRPKGAWEDV